MINAWHEEASPIIFLIGRSISLNGEGTLIWSLLPSFTRSLIARYFSSMSCDSYFRDTRSIADWKHGINRKSLLIYPSINMYGAGKNEGLLCMRNKKRGKSKEYLLIDRSDNLIYCLNSGSEIINNGRNICLS